MSASQGTTVSLQVMGIPDTLLTSPERQEEVPILKEKLQAAVAAIAEMEVGKEGVSVFFSRDQLQDGLGDKIVVIVWMVEGMRRKSSVKKLARCIGTTVRECYEYTPVEVHIQRTPTEGFYAS